MESGEADLGCGIRDSALNSRSIESLLGSTTMRTKGTIDELAAKYFAG